MARYLTAVTIAGLVRVRLPVRGRPKMDRCVAVKMTLRDGYCTVDSPVTQGPKR